MRRKWIIPLIAFGTFIIGSICIILPFLPFGWLLFFITALILSPYFAPIERFLKWIIKKDKTGTFRKARKIVAQLYQWAGDHKRAKGLFNDDPDQT